MHAIFKIEIRGQHGAMKRRQAKFVEKAQLRACEVAVGEKGLGMIANEFGIQAFEEVVGAIAAAEAHHCIGCLVGKSSVKVGEALPGCSGKVERAALESEVTETRGIAESAHGHKAALDAVGLCKRGGRDDADACAGGDCCRFLEEWLLHCHGYQASPFAMREAGPVRRNSVPGPSQATV